MNCHNRISLYSSFTHKCLPFLICGTFISSLSVPVLTDHSFLTGTNQTDPVSSVIRTEPIKSSYSTVSPYPSPNSISVHPYPRQLIQYYSNASPLLWKDFPGVVQLEFPNVREVYKCTGTLIYSQNTTGILLTSALCIPQELRTSDTGRFNWKGQHVYLGERFRIYAGDTFRTCIGYMIESKYVYSPGVSGYNLALIKVYLDPVALSSSSTPEGKITTSSLSSYEWFDTGTQMEEFGIILGYGASLVQVTRIGTIPFVNITGTDTLRSASGMFTDFSLQLNKRGDCDVAANGGELYMDDYMSGFNTVRLCINYGDDGAPFFLPSYAYNQPLRWKLAGIAVMSSDTTGCDGKRHTFTSTEFRTNWITEILYNFTNQPYIPPVCPSVTPTSTVTPTTSPTFYPQILPSLSTSPTPSPTPFVERPINLFWIIFMAIFLCMVVSCTYYWGHRARIRTRFKVTPGLQDILNNPPLDQTSSVLDKEKNAYTNEQLRRHSLAREGNLVDPPRRLSVNTDPRTLEIREQFRNERHSRRRSSILSITGENIMDKSDKDPTEPTLVHRIDCLPKSRRRSSIKDQDRSYEYSFQGSHIGYRFNYTGYYEPTPFTTDAMIVDRRYEPISIVTEEIPG